MLDNYGTYYRPIYTQNDEETLESLIILLRR